MPKRPRTHLLETETINFIRNLIPSQWAFRVPENDYGIDAEVEIFEYNGQATGLLFYIQAKGTDEKNIKKSLSYRMTIEKLRYYKSLPIPVLLIRYISSQKKGYAQWIHSIDPYYRRKGSKSLNVKFLPEDSFTDKHINQIPDHLKFFRIYKNPGFSFPMKFQIDFENETICGVANGTIRSLLNNTADKLRDYMVLSTKKQELPFPKIVISNEEIKVDIIGLVRSVLHLRGKYTKEEVKSKLIHDVFVVAAVALYQLGHVHASAVILYENIFHSGLLNDNGILEIAISCFFEAKRTDLAIKLSEQALDLEKSSFLHIIFALPVFKKANLDEDELIAYEELLILASKKALEQGYTKNAGKCYYNIANRFRFYGNDYLRKSIKYYNLAIKYDPDYSNRDYFWNELAGVLFLLRKFKWSSNCYKKSIELKNSIEKKPLYADALMFSGKYKEALSIFEDYLENGKDIKSEWIFKTDCLREILEEFGIYEQKRDLNNALKYADLTTISDGTNEERLEQSLKSDFLCGLAWYNLGTEYSKKSDFEQASFSFVMAGLVQPNDTEAWSNAILCFINLGKITMLSAVFIHAYSINGEDFYLKLIEQIENQPDDIMPETEKNKLINLFGSCINHLSKDKKDDVILRIFDENNSYKTHK